MTRKTEPTSTVTSSPEAQQHPPQPPPRTKRPGGRTRHLALGGAAILAVAGAIALVCLQVIPSNSHATVQTNCAASPHLCGYPDATNTGVPSGMKLKTVGPGKGQLSSGPGWHFDSRGWVEVDGNGAVLSGLYIPYNLDINSVSNVTVKDVKVVTSGDSSFGISLRHTTNATVENSTIQGVNTGADRLMVGVKDIYADATGTSVLDNNILRVATGVQIPEGLIEGNYIHNMGMIPGDHVNGITVNGSTTPLTIKGNTILVHLDQTDAVSLFQDFGLEANKTIENNLLAGGSYTIYGGDGQYGATSGIVITGNRISTIYYPHGGTYGPVAYFTSSGTGNSWSGNTWDQNGQTIPSP